MLSLIKCSQKTKSSRLTASDHDCASRLSPLLAAITQPVWEAEPVLRALVLRDSVFNLFGLTEIRTSRHHLSWSMDNSTDISNTLQSLLRLPKSHCHLEMANMFFQKPTLPRKHPCFHQFFPSLCKVRWNMAFTRIRFLWLFKSPGLLSNSDIL